MTDETKRLLDNARAQRYRAKKRDAERDGSVTQDPKIVTQGVTQKYRPFTIPRDPRNPSKPYSMSCGLCVDCGKPVPKTDNCCRACFS